ncbi:MAG TPA: hypothetical protein VJ890_21065 [Vineibacter sp.]|nr:hypothetical protein [Vineibacter sp.]
MIARRLEISVSHRGLVRITDAASDLPLHWELDKIHALELIRELSRDLLRGADPCGGTVSTVSGTRVTFQWPRGRTEAAIQELGRIVDGSPKVAS